MPVGSMVERLANVSKCMDIIIPAYQFPTLTNSQWFNNAGCSDFPFPAGRNRWFIANASSGPPTCPGVNCTVYQSAVSSVQAVGASVQVLGYVNGLLAAGLTQMETDITNWVSNFALQGIYFDQVSTDPTQIAGVYQPAVSFATNLIGNALIIMGCGAFPATDALLQMTTNNNGTVAVTYEDYFANLLTVSVPSWVQQHTPSSIYMIIHDCLGQQSMQQAVDLCRQYNAGKVYVTDLLQSSGNPFSQLPSYWSNLTSYVEANC
jgi:hypothetical protein